MNDGQLLLDAICADPEDDTVRLAYADYLDEHGDGARAELIRVQCEFSRTIDNKTGKLHEQFHRTLRISGCRGCDLMNRADDLLATLPDLFPPCPVCATTTGLRTTYHDCKTGRCKGETVRGFLYSVEVPRLDVALTNECPTCRGPNPPHYNEPSSPCPQCGGSTTIPEYRLTRWARDLARDFPTVERVFVADATPFTGEVDGESFGFQWWDRRDINPDGTESEVGYLPPVVFDRLWADWVGQRSQDSIGRWLTFKNDHDARDALAEAVANVVREEAKK